MTCEAHRLAEYHTLIVREDVDLIQQIVRERRPALVLDIGAGRGATALSALEADPTIRVVTIDHDFSGIDNVRGAVQSIAAASRWRGIVADSIEAATEWRSLVFVGLLLLDTSHDRVQTLAEIAAWEPHLASDAVVWIHDFEGEHAGIREAVAELEARGYRRIGKAGLGIALEVPRCTEEVK